MRCKLFMLFYNKWHSHKNWIIFTKGEALHFTRCHKFPGKHVLVIHKILLLARSKKPIHKDFYDEYWLLLLTAYYCILFLKVLEKQDVTKRCLSWLTNSVIVTELKCRGGGGVAFQWVKLCTWSPNNLWRSNSIFNLRWKDLLKFTDC